MPNKITFFEVSSNKPLPINGSNNVWNFCNNYNRGSGLSINPPPGLSINNIGNLINKKANLIRNNFINIDENITTGLFYDSFLASSMGEGNPYLNDFFLNLCRALVLLDIAEKKNNHIILVDDIYLGDALIQTCLLAGVRAKWAFQPTKHNSTRFYQKCRTLGSGLQTMLKKWYLGKKLKTSSPMISQSNPIWLMNWTNDNTFSAEKPDKGDSFYGTIPYEIEKSVGSITWLANPMSWLISNNKILESTNRPVNNIFYVFESITLKTVFRSIFFWLMFPLSIRNKLVLCDKNLSPIISYTISKEHTYPQIMSALLYADIGRTLAKHKIQPETLIYPYENQPWEKILLRNFRKFCPTTKLIGMQHTPFADNYVSCIPSLKQGQNNILPDILVTIGKDFHNRLIHYSIPKNKLEIGGYFRNPKLAKPLKFNSNPTAKRPIILVSCPMNHRDSVELIEKTTRATSSIKNAQIYVNFHPMYGQNMIDDILRNIDHHGANTHVKFVKGLASEWLKKCNVLIYNSSGTVFEAVRLGVPSIYLGPENGIDMDKMPGGSMLKCRTSEELEKIIRKLTTDTLFAKNTARKAYDSMKNCFSYPNPETWINLTCLKTSGDQP